MIFLKTRDNRNDAMLASCTNAEGKRVYISCKMHRKQDKNFIGPSVNRKPLFDYNRGKAFGPLVGLMLSVDARFVPRDLRW